MPGDAYQGLWREFALESGEHLDWMEPLLVRAEAVADGATADTVATLFRGMHSIKGMASALALRGMERLAHHAEHLLGQVREGRCRLDPPLVGVLLEALDELKRLRGVAMASQGDAPVVEAVMERLERARGVLEGVPGPAQAAALDGAGGGGAGEGREAGDPPPLHPDRQALADYVAALGPVLPSLAQLVGPGLESPAVRADVRRALQVVGAGADRLGFSQMARTAGRLVALIPAEGNLGYEAREQAINALAQLRREVATLEQGTGDDGGGQALDDSLNAALSLDYTARRRALLDLLGGFDREPAAFAPGGPAIAQAADLAGEIYNHFSFLYNANAGRLLLMIENVLDHGANGGLVMTPELMGLVRRTLGALAPARGEVLRDLDATAAEAIVAFEAAIKAASAVAGEAAVAVGLDDEDLQAAADRRLFTELAVMPELLERLSPDQYREVSEQIRNGTGKLWEIIANIDDIEEDAVKFATWLEDATQPLTSCVIAGSVPRLHGFLVLTAADDPVVLAALAGMDPDGRMLTARRCIGPAPVQAGETVSGPVSGPIEPPAAAEPSRQTLVPAGIGHALRVPGEVVDHFLAVIGETVMAAASLDDAVLGDDGRGRLALDLKQVVRDLRGHGGADPGHLEALQRYAAAQDSRSRALRRARDRLALSLGRLQEAALELRVVPVETVFASLPRLVRDLAASHGKQVQMEVDGCDVRVDKGMVDQLLEPLIHMVRNAIDHGIETPAERLAANKPVRATLSVRADQRENRVTIEVSDDGRGLDAEAIRARAVARHLIGEAASRLMHEADLFRLILLPGFSTADVVTETSGRGVGMDVVHTKVIRLGGVIEIRSRPGQGTTFILRLPLSAAIQDVLLVETDGRLHALPMRDLLELANVGPRDIQIVHRQPAMLRHGTLLPLYRLTALLEGTPGILPVPNLPVVVLGFGRQRLGLQVDRVLRRQQLFVRDIHPRIAAIPGIGGAAVLGDGRVVLIIDGGDLFQLAQTREPGMPAGRSEQESWPGS